MACAELTARPKVRRRKTTARRERRVFIFLFPVTELGFLPISLGGLRESWGVLLRVWKSREKVDDDGDDAENYYNPDQPVDLFPNGFDF